MFGAVSVQVGDKPTVFLKNMESFIVEKNTMYSIRNLRKDEGKKFTIFKFDKFYD